MIFKDCIHKTNHIGRQFKISTSTAQEIPADDRSHNKSIFNKLQSDIQTAINDNDTLDTIIELLRQAKQIPLQKNLVKAVESLSNDFPISTNERGDILRQLLISEDHSRYGLVQAISSASKISLSYERATELEHIGGELLTSSVPSHIISVIPNQSKKSA